VASASGLEAEIKALIVEALALEPSAGSSPSSSSSTRIAKCSCATPAAIGAPGK